MRKGTWVLTGALGAVGILAVVLAWWFDGAHNGKIAGNEAMAMAALLGLSGLALALATVRTGFPEVQTGVKVLLLGAQAYLVVGALMGNARWAEDGYRFLGYAGVLLSTWISELVLSGADDRGLLSASAVVVGFGSCGFEVIRWLEPAFALPLGQVITPEQLARQEATWLFWTVGVWAPYTLGVSAVAVRLRSQPAMRLAIGLYGVAGGYLAYGLLRFSGPDPLRVGASASLVASLVAAVGLHLATLRSSRAVRPGPGAGLSGANLPH